MSFRRNGGRRGAGHRGVGSGAVYDPSQEDGYLLDFFAEAGVTEAGTGVSSWVDQASSVDVTQGTDANRPTYEATGLGGKPAVLFVRANSDGLLAASFANASTDWTVYMFGDVKGSLASAQFLIDSETGRLTFHVCVPTEVGWQDSGSTKSTTATTTGAQVLTWRLEAGVGGEAWKGSTSLGTAAYTGGAMGARFGLGTNFVNTGSQIDIAVGRTLVFAAVHDAATRTRVWNWGASHYGITL